MGVQEHIKNGHSEALQNGILEHVALRYRDMLAADVL